MAAAAAAAALSSGRGAAGVKGPFFIFTLLCLVCFVSSLIEKDQLEKLKEGYQKTQALLDNVKADYKSGMDTTLEGIDSFMSFFEPLAEVMKDAAPGFSPLKEQLENTKSFMEKTKAYTDDKFVEIGAEIEKLERKHEKMRKLIKFLEEQQAEL
ncbi:hypothetical protein GBF38_005478 [Nibea albiflora]|uniref:Uncharacterized protein n=1 Tax=Nibea albiflora TaxID=240163 RepID=A0ACB7EW28_NIBAL|nr:hypothetical protein GBF38_005478 [Nibea albiflora]